MPSGAIPIVYESRKVCTPGDLYRKGRAENPQRRKDGMGSREPMYADGTLVLRDIEQWAGFGENGASTPTTIVKTQTPISTTKVPRKFPRYAMDTRLSIQVFRQGQTISLWGRSNEIGEDGIGGTVTTALEADEVVSMEFVPPMAAEPLRLRAIVRYRSGLRHGFEFLALKAKQRDALRRACESLSGKA
jgi:hypothetical protein